MRKVFSFLFIVAFSLAIYKSAALTIKPITNDTIKDTTNYDILYPIDSVWRYGDWYESYLYTIKKQLVNLKNDNISYEFNDIYELSYFNDLQNKYEEPKAYVVTKNNKCAIMLPTGKMAVDFKYGSIKCANKNNTLFIVSNGTISDELDGNVKYGVINIKDDIAIPIKYYNLSDFNEGLSCAATKKLSDGTLTDYKFIDEKGKIAINKVFEEARNFNNGVAAVKEKGKKWGYINKSGKYLINPIYDSVSDFDDNSYACVKIDKLSIIIDKSGKNLFEINGWDIENRNNYYCFEKQDKYQLSLICLDKNLNQHDSDPNIENLEFLSNKYMGYNYVNGKYVIINGNKKIELQNIDSLSWVYNNLFVADKTDDTSVLIDDTGKILYSIKGSISHYSIFNFLYVSANGFDGIIDLNGNTVLPTQYNYVECINGSIFRVTQGYYIGYVDRNGNWIYKKSMIESLDE